MRCTRLLSPAYRAGRRRTRRTEAVILPRLGTVPRRARCGAYRKSRTGCHAFVQPPARFFANCLPIRRCSPPIQGRVLAIQRPPGAPAARSACVLAGGRVGSLGSESRPPPISSDRSLMRLSRYFLPILRETPREAEIVSHRLMLRAGLIRQQAAGSFSWLPLGLRVLNKINRIVREEQDRSGAIEVLMPTIQSADLWREVGPLRRLRQGDAAHHRPARARHALRPDQRGDDHRHLPVLRPLLQGPAAQPLPHPVEVPGRGPAALRRHALARVPDEGRLFLRPRPGRRPPLLQQDVRRLSAHLREARA